MIKDAILEWLTANRTKNIDAIDVSLYFKLPIDKTYELLQQLVKKKKLKKEYCGVKTWYTPI
jgi:hypothetical protein